MRADTRVKEIHIWDIPGWTNFVVKVDDGFRERIFRLVQENIGSYSDVIRFYRNTCERVGLRYLNGGRFHGNLKTGGYLRLGPLLYIIEHLGIQRSELEANITAYKCSNSGEKIIKPKLPIIVDPIFDMLVAHHIFDGSIVLNDRATYRQKSVLAAKRFREKVESVIGKLRRASEDPNSFYIPRFLARIFKAEYGCNFYSNSARIPRAITSGSWGSRMSVLIAAVIDEGTIDESNVEVYSANQTLLEDIRNIALSLDYECSQITRYKRRQLFYFNFKPFKKFYSDIRILTRKYPSCDLAHQQVALEFHVNRRKRWWWKRRTGITKKMIIRELINGPRSSVELAYKTQIAAGRICRHLNSLAEVGLDKKVGKRGNSNLWQLLMQSPDLVAIDAIIDRLTRTYPNAKKKRSIGGILEAVGRGLNDTRLISDTIGLHTSTINQYLKEMAKEGYTVKVGRRSRGLARLNVWEINGRCQLRPIYS